MKSQNELSNNGSPRVGAALCMSILLSECAGFYAANRLEGGDVENAKPVIGHVYEAASMKAKQCLCKRIDSHLKLFRHVTRRNVISDDHWLTTFRYVDADDREQKICKALNWGTRIGVQRSVLKIVKVPLACLNEPEEQSIVVFERALEICIGDE